MKRDEWDRYMRQAQHTLESARRDRAGGDHDWASFKAHQAAELAVKGFVRSSREYVTGHSVVKLLSTVDREPPEEIVECAKALDKVYIPARYPDAYDAGSPMDYYTASDADAAIGCAGRILDWLNALASAGSA